MAGITFDTSEWEKNVAKLVDEVGLGAKKGLIMMGDELLRLSSLEVPFQTGMLLSSGVSEQDETDPEGWVVGYNKVYAARLHEHPEYHFSNGRKGKYLEDPIKMNYDLFRSLQVAAYTEAMSA